MAHAATGDRRLPSAAVSEERLWTYHMEMAKIGATDRGGCDRPGLGPEDTESRALFAKWGREAGLQCAVDAIGNVFVRRPGTDPDAPPVITGSHLDTQPKGGRFDGIFGVLGGLEALQAVDDAGIETRRTLEAVAWTNEEGSRFVPGCLGSECYVHPDHLERLLAVTDDEGIVLGDALALQLKTLSDLDSRPLGGPAFAFIEAHIEQGPILEDEDKVIGVVTGITGGRRFTVDVYGEPAHSGTTTRKRRKDAFVSTVRIVSALHEVFHDAEDNNRFTIGRFELEPGSPYIVPRHVRFYIDFRTGDAEVLERLGNQVDRICQDHAAPCTVTVHQFNHVLPRMFTDEVPDRIEEATKRLGHPYMRIFSGAGHDAQNFVGVCPTGMIFVPCEDGVSHAEHENAKPADLAAGVQVLADVMVELANDEYPRS